MSKDLGNVLPTPQHECSAEAPTEEAVSALVVEVLSSDLLPLFLGDECEACALAGVCKALGAALSTDWIWQTLAHVRWPALRHSGLRLPPPGGYRELFRRRVALLPGWRRLTPLFDASIATVAVGESGWPTVLTAQLVLMWEYSRGQPGAALDAASTGLQLFTHSGHSCAELEEVRRWRARLVATLASVRECPLPCADPATAATSFAPPAATSSAADSSTLAPTAASSSTASSTAAATPLHPPPRLLELRHWADSLAADLDSFYNGVSAEDFAPQRWLARIATVLRGRSALQFTHAVLSSGATGPLCESPPVSPQLGATPTPAPGEATVRAAVRARAGGGGGAGGGGDTGGKPRARVMLGVVPTEGYRSTLRLAAACGVARAVEAIDSSLESLLLEGFSVSVPAALRPRGIPRAHVWWWCPPAFARHAQGC